MKYKASGDPVIRLRKKIKDFHPDNIAIVKFWNEHPCLFKELGRFDADARKINPEHTESFHSIEKLLPATWVVIRVDGCHFHRSGFLSSFLSLISDSIPRCIAVYLK